MDFSDQDVATAWYGKGDTYAQLKSRQEDIGYEEVGGEGKH